MSFLTVEDVNSVIMNNYYTPFWQSINIDIGSDVDFTNVKFDFLNVSRTYVNGKYKFTLTCNNYLFMGYYYIIDGNGNRVTSIEDYNSFTSDTPNVIYNCYMNMIEKSVRYHDTNWFINDLRVIGFKGNQSIVLPLTAIGDYVINDETFTVRLRSDDAIIDTFEVVCEDNKLRFEINNSEVKWLQVRKDNENYTLPVVSVAEKPLLYAPNSELFVGEVNNVTVKSDVPLEAVNVTCNYPVTNIRAVDDNIIFDLDLTREYDLNKKIKININSLNSTIDYPYFTEELDFHTVAHKSSDGGFMKLVEDGGGLLVVDEYLELPVLQQNVHISKDTIITGNSSMILRDYNFIIESGVTFKMEGIDVQGVNGFIIQEAGSNVELTNCTFTSIEPAKVGGVIRCNINKESLQSDDDFRTIITNCNFNNIGQCILHGGYLEVTDCGYNNDAMLGLLSDYPYFVYQTDGDLILKNNSFNISYYDTSGNEEVTFMPCLFVAGENATVNGLNYSQLQKNNLNEVFNVNSSWIDMTYYYPLIDNLVQIYGSGFCHGVSGVDYVFKTEVDLNRME